MIFFFFWLFLDYQEFIEMKTLGLVIIAISILTSKNPAKENRYGDWSKIIITLQGAKLWIQKFIDLGHNNSHICIGFGLVQVLLCTKLIKVITYPLLTTCHDFNGFNAQDSHVMLYMCMS